MKTLILIFSFGLLISCGQGKTRTEKNKKVKDSTIANTPPAQDKSYLKKRPEEFKEFFMLTDVQPFSGKVATKRDVKSGAAVFNMDSKKDPSHKALNIRMPFFAFLIQPNKKPSKFVVIMQAETLRGDTMLGYKEPTGLFGICKPRELEYFEAQKGEVYKTIENN